MKQPRAGLAVTVAEPAAGLRGLEAVAVDDFATVAGGEIEDYLIIDAGVDEADGAIAEGEVGPARVITPQVVIRANIGKTARPEVVRRIRARSTRRVALSPRKGRRLCGPDFGPRDAHA